VEQANFKRKSIKVFAVRALLDYIWINLIVQIKKFPLSWILSHENFVLIQNSIESYFDARVFVILQTQQKKLYKIIKFPFD
jgi:hypothetical protein